MAENQWKGWVWPWKDKERTAAKTQGTNSGKDAHRTRQDARQATA